jgi:hypothetical protein
MKFHDEFDGDQFTQEFLIHSVLSINQIVALSLQIASLLIIFIKGIPATNFVKFS